MARAGLPGLVWTNLLLLICTFSQVCSIDQVDIQNIYGFNATDIDGKEISFEKYRGYVLLIVNVASECGLTSNNYQQLNELYTKYEKAGLRLAAFPCNQFGGQEPGDREVIKQFISKQNVRFDVYAKIDVNGENAHDIFQWLKSKLSGILYLDAIKWNFTKFLLDCYGQPVKRYGPLEEPKDIEPDIINEIQRRAQMLANPSESMNAKNSKQYRSGDEL